MPDQEAFLQAIREGYAFTGDSFVLGAAMLEGKPCTGALVRVPLRTMNRHGLIAGATGTGKTKTLQVIAEGLSAASVPVLLMDIKGDLSGLAKKGEANDKINARVEQIGVSYAPSAFPVELLTISEESGTRIRSTVTEFGPVLMSRILGLNTTQEGLMALIFKYCDDHRMPLLDLKDLIRMLQYISDQGRKEIEKEYGRISTGSTGTILRKVIELQQQGADLFFGEPSFEIEDLMRLGSDGRGMINILRVTDLQNRPKLFSTFMLGLLAELYGNLPEEGDLDRPKLVIFLDEAHLIFQEATDALLEQLLTVVKLIRSKGVGVIFCTQNPQDIPAGVLSQLGMKVQHALRAFTAADRKGIRQAAQNYPDTPYYDVDSLLTAMGTGEAFVTLLNEKGIPTPLAHTLIVPPASRMDILTPGEILDLVSASRLKSKYEKTVDNESAYEILTRKMEAAAEASAQEQAAGKQKPEKSAVEKVLDHTITKQIGRTAAGIITRSLLGALGIGRSSSSRKSLF